MDDHQRVQISEELDREAAALIGNCLVAESPPSNQQLRRLSLLLQVRGQLAAHPTERRRPHRWIIPLIFLAIYGVVSFLASRPVATIGINIEGTFSDIILQSTDRQVLDGLTVSDLRVSGFHHFQIESDDRGAIIRSSDIPGDGNVRVKGAGIRMHTVFGTAETVYAISSTETPNRFLLKLSRPEPHQIHEDESLVFFDIAGLGVDVGGKSYRAGSGGRLILTMSSTDQDILEVEFGVSADQGLQLIRDVEAHTLVFSPLTIIRPDGFSWLNRSSVLLGTVEFFSLKDKRYELKNGECLDLRDPTGRVTEIRVKDHAVHFTFSGDVSDVRASTCMRSRSIKPSKLEWFIANEKISLILAAAGTVIGAVFAVVRWWSS